MTVSASEHVKLRQAPLKRVICQLRYPPILGFNAAVVRPYQQAVEEDYPTPRVEQVVAVNIIAGVTIFGEIIREDVKRLGEFARLEYDWDSYDASPIAHDALGMTYLLLASVAMRLAFRLGEQVRPCVIVPTVDGGTQIEWRGPGGIIEIGVDPDESLSYLLLRPGQEPVEREDVPLEQLQQLVIDVVRGQAMSTP